MSKKVLFVVGSLREKSFNKTVAEYISKKLEEKGIETSFLDYSKLPFMNQDIEFPTPSEVEKVRTDVKRVLPVLSAACCLVSFLFCFTIH